MGGVHGRVGSTGKGRESVGMVAGGDGEEGAPWPWIWIRVNGGREGRENMMKEGITEREGGVVHLVVAHAGEPRYH